MRILILCTGNSCRSQMAEGFIKQLKPDWEVHSAGTNPVGEVHALAIAVMAEAGVDLSSARPESVDNYVQQSFDYVITVCDNARETCPIFTGIVANNMHMGFVDPAGASGATDEVLRVFREVRDKIKVEFTQFVASISGA